MEWWYPEYIPGVPKTKPTLFDEREHNSLLFYCQNILDFKSVWTNLYFGTSAIPVRYIFFEIFLFEGREWFIPWHNFLSIDFSEVPIQCIFIISSWQRNIKIIWNIQANLTSYENFFKNARGIEILLNTSRTVFVQCF